MAEAEVREIVHTEITLKLTPAEAGTLLALTSAVSGHAIDSPRGVSTAVYRELRHVEASSRQVADAYARARRLMRVRDGGTPGIHFESDGAQHG